MLRNYLKVALRNFMHHKAHAFINLFGLTIGMVCTSLILLYVNFEMSYDGFHLNKNNLYRINKVSYENGELNYKSAFTFSGQGPVTKSEIPEVVDYVRLFHSEGVLQNLRSNNELVSFREKDIYYADASFFNLFSYHLIIGETQSALEKPNSIVLSESSAKKYFGSENPIGKVIKYKNEDFIVNGVFEDIPQNSHLTFSALLSFSSLKISDENVWSTHAFYTYILLKDKTNPNDIEPKLSKAFEKFIEKYHNNKISNIWDLQRVDDIYLYSTDFTSISMEYGSYKTVLYMLVIAFLILIIAWLNYVNLSTAVLSERSKEIGVRKVVGATKGQLIKQFVMESLLINFVALTVSAAIVESLKPIFQQYLGIHASLSLIQNNLFFAILISLFIIGVLLTSIYPAIWLSSISAISAMKKNMNRSAGGFILRKVFITFQFAISIALMIITFIIYEQISFTRNADLGMKIDDVLVIRTSSNSDQQIATYAFERFKQILLSNTSIGKASFSQSVPGERFGIGFRGVIRKENSDKENLYFRVGRVDPSFVDLYDIKLLAGKNFTREYELDNKNVVLINVTAMKEFGFTNPEDAVGKFIKWSDRLFMINGVTSNFHQESFHRDIEPIILYDNTFEKNNYISVKLGNENINSTLSFIEKTYKTVFPGQPFDYFFLNDFFNKQYRSDLKIGEIISLFALLAIVIALLGLFSLASFSATKRTKEIGVRKVIGATVFNIVVCLTKDFTKWVIIANFIAWPIAYYFMNIWLQSFAYRINISLWMFVLSGGLALMIALLTVSWQAIRAARSNPVESLRNE
jgi:putative ABC transport system permease protein